MVPKLRNSLVKNRKQKISYPLFHDQTPVITNHQPSTNLRTFTTYAHSKTNAKCANEIYIY